MKQKKSFAGSAYRHFLIWSILSSLMTTACDFIDAVLVGNLLGGDGLAVLNIARPVFLTCGLIGVTLGGGAAVTIGRCIGAGENDRARHAFSSLLTLGLAMSLLCMSPLLFLEPFYGFLGVTDELLPAMRQYMPTLLCASPIIIMFAVLSAAVGADSDPVLCTACSASVVIINPLLDVVFIKYLNFGMRGSALAYATADIVGCAILLLHFFKKHRVLSLRTALPRAKEMGNFVRDGSGAGSAKIFGAVIALAFNTLLSRSADGLGSMYLAIYAVINSAHLIPSGLFTAASGAASGVTSFLVGESDKKGIKEVRDRSLLTAAALGVLATLVCELLAEPIVKLIGVNDAAELALAASVIRIYATSLIFIGINTVITSYWQSVGRAQLAFVMSLMRNCLVGLLFGALLIPGHNVRGLALTYLLTEVVGSLFALGVMIFSPSAAKLDKLCPQNELTFENTYTIKKESVELISSDLSEVCREWEVAPASEFLISFVCEEMLLNIEKFALGNTKKNFYISIKLMRRGEEHILRIRDNVRLYDPFESNGDEIDNGVLAVIRKKSKKCEYQRKMIFNYLYIVI